MVQPLKSTLLYYTASMQYMRCMLIEYIISLNWNGYFVNSMIVINFVHIEKKIWINNLKGFLP